MLTVRLSFNAGPAPAAAAPRAPCTVCPKLWLTKQQTMGQGAKERKQQKIAL